MIQVGATRSIATFLQRVGRAGHARRRACPRAALFPLTLDELVEAAALLRCVRARRCSTARRSRRARSTSWPSRSWRRASAETWDEDALFERLPARLALPRPARERVRRRSSRCTPRAAAALLHRDGVQRPRCAPRRRARITALTSGGAIPDTADYQVRARARGHVRRHAQRGLRRSSRTAATSSSSATPRGASCASSPASCASPTPRAQPPTHPVLARRGAGAHARAVGGDRPTCASERGRRPGSWLRMREIGLLAGGRRRSSPSTSTEGEQRAGRGAHAASASCSSASSTRAAACSSSCTRPSAARINRAWGLALRKRFCRGFGFELQAAANEEAIVLSLGPQHSFPLEEVFDYLHPDDGARRCWCRRCSTRRCSRRAGAGTCTRALLLERSRERQAGAGAAPAHARRRPAGAGVPAGAGLPARRCRPATSRCPMEHPIVRQTIEDCLHEAMDVDGLPRGAARPARRARSSAWPSTPPSPRRSRAAS